MARHADSIGTRTCRPVHSQGRPRSLPVLVVVLGLGGGPDHAAAQASWRGLVVAPEARCAPYDAAAYRYPQSVEARIVAALGGVYGPYTGRWFASPRDTDIEHIDTNAHVRTVAVAPSGAASTRRRCGTVHVAA